MIKDLYMENETKHNHHQECACGCSAAYDEINDEQFEKAFQLNILSKKHIFMAAIAIVTITAMAAAAYFIL